MFPAPCYSSNVEINTEIEVADFVRRIAEAVLSRSIVLRVERAWMDCEYMVLVEISFSDELECIWKGIIAIDLFDERLPFSTPRTHTLTIARHILRRGPWGIPSNALIEFDEIERGLTTALTTMTNGARLGRVQSRDYLSAPIGEITMLPPREFAAYVGYSSPDTDGGRYPRIGIVSRSDAPHRYVHFLPAPGFPSVVQHSFKSAFALCEWTCDQVNEALAKEGRALERRWKRHLWGTIFGPTREEVLLEVMTEARPFVVFPSALGLLHAASVAPETISIQGREIFVSIEDGQINEQGKPLRDFRLVARFASATEARQARSLILRGIEPRVDRLPDTIVDFLGYTFRASDSSLAGCATTGADERFEHYWDKRYGRKASASGGLVRAPWRVTAWSDLLGPAASG